ncbi:MAG TPA: hypothetical protein ENF75_02955 [Acidilobales archaeon]|nr:hypothetical protein [Acidilobales archaeon]
MDIDLSVNLAGVELKSPIVVSAGVINEDYILKALKTDVGAVILGSYALSPKSTHPPPFIIKLGYGFVNAYGIRKSISEIRGFMLKVIDVAERNDVKVFCSVIEDNVERTSLIAKEAEELGCRVIELNLSAPIIPNLLTMGLNLDVAKTLVMGVSKCIKVPLSVKLSPLIQDIGYVGKELLKSGASILHLINALSPAMVIDIEAGKPMLKTKDGLGAFTGPSIKPIALAKVYLTAKELPEAPIIGTGGVTSWRDAIEMIMVGASAVGIHSALYLKGVEVINEIVNGIKNYLRRKGIERLNELRGLVLKNIQGTPREVNLLKPTVHKHR